MADNPYSLEGKLILVTGAGTGIGQGIALEAARQGAHVALQYNSSAEGALDAAARIESLGQRAIALKADLGVVAECRQVVDEAARFLGGLDGLVNNAGTTATVDFRQVGEDLFDRIYHVNIRGQYFCAQQALGWMLERGGERDRAWAGGSIVNVSSVHGLVGCPGHSIYAGTKGAIIAWSRELAVELCPQHVRVNVLVPGSIEVPRYWKVDPGYTREAGDTLVPWGRIGLPQDVAYLTCFLLSDASEFMTGAVLAFDGGLTAKMALPIQPPATEG